MNLGMLLDLASTMDPREWDELVAHELGKVLEGEVNKHEGGGHDQKTHGNWARGSANPLAGPGSGTKVGKALRPGWDGEPWEEVDIEVTFSGPGSIYFEAHSQSFEDVVMEVLAEFPPHLRPTKVLITDRAPTGGGAWNPRDISTIEISPWALPLDRKVWDRLQQRDMLPEGVAMRAATRALMNRDRERLMDKLRYILRHETTHLAEDRMMRHLDRIRRPDLGKALAIEDWRKVARPLVQKHFDDVSAEVDAAWESVAGPTPRDAQRAAWRGSPLFYTATVHDWIPMESAYGASPIRQIQDSEALAEYVAITADGGDYPGGEILGEWLRSESQALAEKVGEA